MELVETTKEIASFVIEKGHRKVLAQTIYGRHCVQWLNINNDTCFVKFNKTRGMMLNNEDVIKFYIAVPKNAKTIY